MNTGPSTTPFQRRRGVSRTSAHPAFPRAGFTRLSTLSVVALAALAGCKDNSGDTDYEQPELGAETVSLIDVDDYQFKDMNANGTLDPYEDWRLGADERADDLVARMTLAEKAGAMLHINMDSDGTEAYTLTRIEQFAGAGVSRRNDAPAEYIDYTNRVQAAAENTRLSIPFAISTDPRSHVGDSQYGVSLLQEGLTQWPQPAGFGAIAMGDEAAGLEMTEEAGEVIREEYRALGIQVALHPQVDLPTEPRWGRIMGNFATEDATLTGKLGAAYVRGLQGDELDDDSVAAMAKHFSGGGPQEDGIDAHLEQGKRQVYPGDNFEYHKVPFEALIENNVASIMPYYGIPVDQTSENVGMGFNRDIITGQLRREMGYDGIVCTDWGIISDSESLGGFIGMPWGVEGLSQAERVAKALNAGVDQFGGLDDPQPILDAVDQELVTEERLDRSLRKLLAQKMTLGLFENPYVDAAEVDQHIGQHQDLADQAQIQSTVLLKNDNTLPVATARADTRVYIDGMTAAEVSELGVTGTDDVASADIAIVRVAAPYSVVPGLGISAANAIFQMPGGPLVYGPYDGLSSELSQYTIYDEDDNLVTDPSTYQAANYDDLTRIQDVVANKGSATRVIVDVYMGRPAILTEFIDDVDAVFASFGSSDANLLQLVFGDASPTGKLPFELPSSMEAVEAQYEDVPYDSADPLFDYGYGLSY
ncbi:glycoside hydrolase family 3 protein [Marinobacter bohaiensis]|uniref:glycoside hydrolase family 3 protein n=1 Tax=Marinobacter bohaiensis TaxID=2201898 RepID=UPI0013A7021D|nr:glycoside hydrolase family 3 N-terminal domain-containing protein [Marinobacter bohaiensis]